MYSICIGLGTSTTEPPHIRLSAGRLNEYLSGLGHPQRNRPYSIFTTPEMYSICIGLGTSTTELPCIRLSTGRLNEYLSGLGHPQWNHPYSIFTTPKMYSICIGLGTSTTEPPRIRLSAGRLNEYLLGSRHIWLDLASQFAERQSIKKLNQSKKSAAVRSVVDHSNLIIVVG